MIDSRGLNTVVSGRIGEWIALGGASEEDVKASGLEWIIARNSLYLDLDVKTMQEKAGAGIYQNNGGDGLAGYISIDEIAYATAKLAVSDTHNCKTLNIGGDLHTQQELVDMANDTFGMTIRYEAMSDDEHVARMMQLPHVAQRREEVARMLPGCFQAIRKGAYSDWALERVTGVDPELRPELKKAGLLTRDPRAVERKKYGLKKARRAEQYTKR